MFNKKKEEIEETPKYKVVRRDKFSGETIRLHKEGSVSYIDCKDPIEVFYGEHSLYIVLNNVFNASDIVSSKETGDGGGYYKIPFTDLQGGKFDAITFTRGFETHKGRP